MTQGCFANMRRVDLAASPNTVVATLDLRRLFGPHWHAVTRQERDVIELRYGMCNGATHTIREVAAMLSLSMSKAYRLERAASRKLLASEPGLPIKRGK